MILKGRDVVASINTRLKNEITAMGGHIPGLAIVRVGEKPEDIAYERGALKRMEIIGLRAAVYSFPSEIEHELFAAAFTDINRNPDIDGILLLRPLPKQINEAAIQNIIDPDKDIDGFSPANIAKVFSGDESGFAPCTAEAVMEMLKFADITLSGKRVAVIGRSMVVGKPLSMLLLKQNATVTICHTKTIDTEKICRESEIIIAAAGSAKLINDDYVSEGAVVIDVGINTDTAGNLCGDVDFDSVSGAASLITPVPGGVGTVTTSVLAAHVVLAAKKRLNA